MKSNFYKKITTLTLLLMLCSFVIAQERRLQKEAKTVANIIKMKAASPVEGMLILVDGVKWEKSLDDIQMDRVEDIQMLDASEAQKLYGEEGHKGAIIITTKEADFDLISFYTNGFLSRKALITIDGVENQYEDLGTFDMMTVGSIALYKEASATKLFGVKGKSGALVLTRNSTANPESSVIQNPIYLLDGEEVTEFEVEHIDMDSLESFITILDFSEFKTQFSEEANEHDGAFIFETKDYFKRSKSK